MSPNFLSWRLSFGVNVEESPTLDILGVRIQNDLCWTERAFEVPKDAAKGFEFLKRRNKYFPGAIIHTMSILYPSKLENNSDEWAGASKLCLVALDCIKRKVEVLISGKSVFKNSRCQNIKLFMELSVFFFLYRKIHTSPKLNANLLFC